MAEHFLTDANIFPNARLKPILDKFGEYPDQKFQIFEHMDYGTYLKSKENLPLVIFHSEGNEKYMGIADLTKYGTFLHCNYKLTKGKFFNYWAYDYLRRIEDYGINLNNKNNFQPKFLCLNGRPVTHRYYTVQRLVDKNLFKNGLVSFLNRYDNFSNEIEYIHFVAMYGSEPAFMRNLYKQQKTLVLDKSTKEVSKNDRTHAEYIYQKTCCSLVTETDARAKHGLFITEKTWKPIANCHIPFFIAQPGMIKFLQDLGFDTFDDIVDNSYDSIVDDKLRYDTCIDSMSAFLKQVKCVDKYSVNKRLQDNQKKYLSMRINKEEIQSWL